jgi:hypothetical protein
MTLIALIDGPLPPDHPAVAQLIDVRGGAVVDSPAGRHATAVAGAILAGAPGARFVNIAVFAGTLGASAADLAAALDTAAGTGAPIVHCSLGLPRDDGAIAGRVARICGAGRIVVASAPARGGPVWPAALPDVISVQGDARCGPGQWSRLGLPTADYGACPRSAAPSGIAGASVAAANLTSIIVGLGWSSPDTARHALDAGAAYRGRERRGSAAGDDSPSTVKPRTR